MLAQTTQGAARPLAGLRILVVEDEYFIADDVQHVLEQAGASVLGPVATLAAAHKALDAGAFDCAVIDLNLNGDSAAEIGDRLLAEGHSFAIATGYGSPAVPDRLQGAPRIEKPFDPAAIIQLVQRLDCANAR